MNNVNSHKSTRTAARQMVYDAFRKKEMLPM